VRIKNNGERERTKKKTSEGKWKLKKEDGTCEKKEYGDEEGGGEDE
jgi:hypothetical protein